MTPMTASQRLKAIIIQTYIEMQELPTRALTAENVDAVYAEYDDDMGDAREEIRAGRYNTGLTTEYNGDLRGAFRNYEYDEVAMQDFDGKWIGWTYWHGGGKHSEPTAIPWVELAYFLDCKEEEQVMVVRTFSKPA